MMMYAFTVASLATHWGVSKSFVYDRCQSGDLCGAFKLGGKLWRIPVDVAKDYVRRQQDMSAMVSSQPPAGAESVEAQSYKGNVTGDIRLLRLGG